MTTIAQDMIESVHHSGRFATATQIRVADRQEAELAERAAAGYCAEHKLAFDSQRNGDTWDIYGGQDLTNSQGNGFRVIVRIG